MGKMIRKIVLGSKERGDYSLNIPKEIVEKFGLEDCYVEIKEVDESLIITKIGKEEVVEIKEDNTTYF